MIPVSLGKLEFLLDGGAVRRIRWLGTETVRHVSSPVRATDWSTLPETVVAVDTVREENHWRHVRTTTVQQRDQQACVVLTVEASADDVGARLVFAVDIRASTAFDTNRAGLCLLHPLDGVRATTIEVDDPDGVVRTVTLPGTDDIAPAQPVRDIAGISQRIGDVAVRLTFDGETFEMEDQRNWTDASFKTYCRPLASARPVRLETGESLHQSISIALESADTPSSTCTPTTALPAASVRLPRLLLAVEPAWLDTPVAGCDGLIARFGPSIAWSDESIAQLVTMHDRLGGTLDLEIVVPAGADANAHLRDIRGRLDAAGLSPDHVMALPEPYLASHPPEGPWPPGVDPDALAELTRTIFRDARIGAGVLTFFTELNRCRPGVDIGDYVTFGTAAIVHAADSMSVFETLEALPDVFASAHRIADGRPLRLGLIAIGMRSNPYGVGLRAPRTDTFVTMTDRDARHTGAAGAAFAVAATLLAARADVEAICLGAPVGPFGLIDDRGAPTPLAGAIDVLRHLSAGPVTMTGEACGVLEAASTDITVRIDTRAGRIGASPAFTVERRTSGTSR